MFDNTVDGRRGNFLYCKSGIVAVFFWISFKGIKLLFSEKNMSLFKGSVSLKAEED